MPEDSPRIQELAKKFHALSEQLASDSPMTADEMETRVARLASASQELRDLNEALCATPEARLQAALPRESRYGKRRITRQALLPISLQRNASASVHRLKIGLYGAKAPTWRRIDLPSTMTLDVLHQVIQTAFGWEDLHPHSFQTLYGEFGNPDHSDATVTLGDESAVAVGQVANPHKIIYVYGRDWEWRHDINVRIEPAEPGTAYPRRPSGRGTPPGEESGGPEAWNRALTARGWSPDDPFDPGQITQAIARLVDETAIASAATPTAQR